MLTRPRVANPSAVLQAPDHKALNHATQLVVPGQPLSTPPIAQEYFEPGVNTKLTRRRTPKTNYTLPSDMPTYPLGFVPTNQTPGPLAGQEPPQIKVKEGVPADLLQVFARISAEQDALAKLPRGGIDAGQQVATEMMAALKEKNSQAIYEKFIAEGHTEEMINDALYNVKVASLEKRIVGGK
jgi:hypothetical protein